MGDGLRMPHQLGHLGSSNQFKRNPLSRSVIKGAQKYNTHNTEQHVDDFNSVMNCSKT